ncbi:DUF4328 domain-containing protein [Haloferula chungangensis]|uniref:DUF4328 domain-containing protein n=1 Tax=Haloferula chungangensis TaxID=1048331 RepID=A0ABW2L788_9BACT
MSEEPMNPYAAPKEASLLETGASAEGVKVDDPTVLARWTIGLLVFVTAYDLLVHAFLTFDAEGTLGVLASMDLVENGSLVGMLAYFVIFLCWMYRVMWNAKRVDPSNAKISPGFGVGSYFIPILNFWVPCRALMQASRSTLGEAKVVLYWWLASMGMIVVVVFYIILLLSGLIHVTEEMLDDPESVNSVTWVDHFIVMADLIITFLEVTMILPLTRRQREWSMVGVASPA